MSGTSNAKKFLFRDSLDVDRPYNLENIQENNMWESGMMSDFGDRNKRSAITPVQNIRNIVKNCEGKDCSIVNNVEIFDKPRYVPNLRPATLFNEYPYEVAILLGMNKISIPSNKTHKCNKISHKNCTHHTSSNQLNSLKIANESLKDIIENVSESQFKMSLALPKRSMKEVGQIEILKEIQLRSNMKNDTDNKRDILDSNDQIVPVLEQYKVIPRKSETKQTINENGLIKVLSLLAKTFKKISKQHSDIKKIHNYIEGLNVDFLRNIEIMSKKFESFDSKYSFLIRVLDKLKALEKKMITKDEDVKNKEKEILKQFYDLESQQKKFLSQQKQFYNVQKIMLAQNEKISIKQNLISKTQSDIAQRQSSFTKILKKAKEIILGKSDKGSLVLPKSTENNYKGFPTSKYPRISATPDSETVKINLFAIPATSKIENNNYDQKLLQDAGENSVDELIFKHYFNNTFIDYLIRKQMLSSGTVHNDNSNVQNKREGAFQEIINDKGVYVYSVTEPTIFDLLRGHSNRRKRWTDNIKGTNKKILHSKTGAVVPNEIKTLPSEKPQFLTGDLKNKMLINPYLLDNDNPYLEMAKNFCSAMGQNSNTQVYSWCVEKTLRRLQKIDFPEIYMASPPQAAPIAGMSNTANVSPSPVTSAPVLSVTQAHRTSESLTVSPSTENFFPNNEELEFDINDFELRPDPEGTVYYDASIGDNDKVEPDNSQDAFFDVIFGHDSKKSPKPIDPKELDIISKDRRFQRRMQKMKINFKG